MTLVHAFSCRSMDLSDFEEALADRPADERWELIDGRLVRRPAGTRADHAGLVRRIASRLMDAIDAAGSDLEVFRETFYLRSAPLNSALLPDVMAVADRFQPLARAASEPVIVVEVTTPGTIGRDWWEKRLVYQRFESLSSYLLVHRDGPRADLFRRNGDRWRAESLEDDAAQVVFPEIGLTMRLGDVYGTVREHTVTR